MAMHRSARHTLASMILALLITAVPAQAESLASHASGLMLTKRSLSLQEAAGQAQRQYGGKVIKADPVHLQGRNAYRIRMVRPDGRVKEVMLDATSGKPLRRKRK